MRPLISYYGGKQRMAGKIVPLIPPHTVYVEPFAGGAAVFYAKPNPNITSRHHYREALNDTNHELVNMYQFAKALPGCFASMVKATPFSHSILRSARNLNSAAPTATRAHGKYIRHNQSFSGLDGSSFCRATFGHNDAKSWNHRQNNVDEKVRRLEDVYLDCQDAIKCIRAWDSPQTFFFIDPPYLGTDCEGMGPWDLGRASALCDTLNACRGSWIVSGYQELRGILQFKKRLAFSANCSATQTGKAGSTRNHGEPIAGVGRERTEQLFMRGPTQPVRSSLIPVLEKQTCFTGPLLGPCPLPLKTHPSARRASTP